MDHCWLPRYCCGSLGSLMMIIMMIMMMIVLMTIMTMWPRWELCGPFINTCKRLLSSLITAEPKLIRTVADRKKLLTKVIFKALLAAAIFPHYPGILICMCEALADLQVWGPVITGRRLMDWTETHAKCLLCNDQGDPGPGAVVTSHIGCHDRLDQIWLWLLSYGQWVMLWNAPMLHRTSWVVQSIDRMIDSELFHEIPGDWGLGPARDGGQCGPESDQPSRWTETGQLLSSKIYF